MAKNLLKHPEMGAGSRPLRAVRNPREGAGARPLTRPGVRGNGSRPTSIPQAFRPVGTLGRAAAGKDPYQLHLNVLGLQHYLNNLGYHVATDGKLGPLTKQALKDAITSGTIKDPSAAQMRAVQGVRGGDIGPKAFDKMMGNVGHAPYVQHAVGKNGNAVVNKGGSLNPGLGPGGNGGGNGSVNPTNTMKALKGANGQAIPASDANFGQLFNVDNTAQSMAQEQFQPQINEQQLLVNRDPRQAAQNEADVKNWYEQVLAAQGKAGSADKAATSQGVDATNAQTQALVNSLGGSANQGAGEAAAAGQNASGTLRAIGAAQQGLDAELQPILQAQAAQQRTNQANTDQAKQQADQLALQDLQGQEGNAQVNAQMQLQSANNSLDQARQQALQNILEYNNSLKQQQYQNQLGLLTTQTAAAMNGVNMAKSAAETNYYNARAQHAASGGGMSASQINDIQKQLMAALGSKGLIVSPSSGVFKLAPGVTPAQALQFSRNFVSSYGNLPGAFVPNTLNAIQGY